MEQNIIDWHVILIQFVSAQCVPRAIEFMKKSQLGVLGWINSDTKTTNRLLSLGAALSTVGFAVVFDGSIVEGGKLIFTIPPLTAALATLAQAWMQTAAQKGIYHSIKDRAPLMSSLTVRVSGNLKPQEPPKS